jgi:hypothetical protein
VKEGIKEFANEMGVDDLGVCSVQDYRSPRSPALDTLFPAARSIVVLAFGDLSGCKGLSPYLAMNGRLDLQAFSLPLSEGRPRETRDQRYGPPKSALPCAGYRDF